MLRSTHKGERFELTSPVAMPRAAGFLWNRNMMINVTCRGYAIAQFMQPEPAKYAYAPNLEARTFMQPEHPYYAHHPGRFFYVKDEETRRPLLRALRTGPRANSTVSLFSVGKDDLRWTVEKDGIALDIMLSLPASDPLELWVLSFAISPTAAPPEPLPLFPYRLHELDESVRPLSARPRRNRRL